MFIFFSKFLKAIRFLVLLMAILFLIKTVKSQSENDEFRAVWISTVSNLDWPKPAQVNNVTSQKAELTRMLTLYKSMNLNAVFFQVRTECDAFYSSAYEPWSRYLTGTQGVDPGYDPLQYAITECNRLGLELHAWLNPYRINASTNDGG